MSVYTSESPETLTDTVQRACVVHEESLLTSLCNMPTLHRQEAGNHYKLFVRPFRGLGDPRIRRCGLVVLPHLNCCTLWSSQSAAFLVRRKTGKEMARERVPESADLGSADEPSTAGEST